MKGVKFGTFHTYDDFGLVLSEKEIKSPTPKIKQIEVEGSDGVLDMTEAFGGVKYNNRSLSFTFTYPYISTEEDFLGLFTTVQNAIHGQKMNVVLDDDLEHYYFGRVSVNEWKSEKKMGKIVIEVDSEPYKMMVEETVVTRSVSGSLTINLTNGRKHVVPTITSSAAMTYAFGIYSKSVSAGTFRIPEFELVEGNNEITVTGTGTVTFRYRKGDL